MKILLVVDLQIEFVKDSHGRMIYEKCISYIREHRESYDTVYAVFYRNQNNKNMQRYVHWDKMKDSVQPMDFQADKFFPHSGYAISEYPFQAETDFVDVIGFDTDACVLNTCFDLFNRDIAFRIIADGCWSSGGEQYHRIGLEIMRRQFRDALDEETLIG